jgi:hypothetical protein
MERISPSAMTGQSHSLADANLIWATYGENLPIDVLLNSADLFNSARVRKKLEY